MPFLKGPQIVTAQDLYNSSATKLEPVGSLAYGSKGRLYRYVLVGASDLVAGNIIQESAEDTTYENMVVGTAGVAGDPYIQVTNQRWYDYCLYIRYKFDWRRIRNHKSNRNFDNRWCITSLS